MKRPRDPRYRSYAVIDVELEDRPSEEEGPPELQEIARHVGDLAFVGAHEDGALLFYYKTPLSQALVDQFKAEAEAAGYGVVDTDWGDPF